MADIIPFESFTKRQKIRAITDSFWKWLLFRFHTHEWKDEERINIFAADGTTTTGYIYVQRCENTACAARREWRVKG